MENGLVRRCLSGRHRGTERDQAMRYDFHIQSRYIRTKDSPVGFDLIRSYSPTYPAHECLFSALVKLSPMTSLIDALRP